MKVEILSTTFVKPSIQTPPKLRKHKLSFFDQLAPPAFPGIVFFFPPNTNAHKPEPEPEPEPEPNTKILQRLEQLEKSLSQTLTRFHPLAGQLIREDLIVNCNDQGVEVSRARVGAPMDEFVHRRSDPELLNHFAPNPGILAGSGLSPILAIQITMFQCGGIAVGMRTSHRVTDGFTALTFIKEWAVASKEGIDKVVSPSFDLGSLFPNRDLSGLIKPSPITADKRPKKIVTRKFVFDGAMISALKAQAAALESETIESVPKRQPSKVLVVTALLWRTLIHLVRAKHGHLRSSLLSLSMDLRERTGLKAPKTAFGNLYSHSIARFMVEENKLELHELVSLLGEAIKKTTEEYGKAQDSDEIFSMLLKYYNEIGANRPTDVDVYHFTSLGRFACYEVDFGWGKPIWVSTTTKPVELISLMNTKCGEGIEAWVSLDEADMVEFERHPDIVALSSQPSDCNSEPPGRLQEIEGHPKVVAVSPDQPSDCNSDHLNGEQEIHPKVVTVSPDQPCDCNCEILSRMQEINAAPDIVAVHTERGPDIVPVSCDQLSDYNSEPLSGLQEIRCHPKVEVVSSDQP